MNRNELKTIAEGFKKVRPQKMVNGYVSMHPGGGVAPLEVESFHYAQWRTDVLSVADALQLDRQARSLFEAACGLIHSDQG